MHCYVTCIVTAALAFLAPASATAQSSIEVVTASSAQQTFPAGQLDALLAPLALYDDTLLAQVLMASGNPMNPLGAAAFVAYPAEYANSGIMSFLINHDSNVFQNDLGPRTAQITARDVIQPRSDMTTSGCDNTSFTMMVASRESNGMSTPRDAWNRSEFRSL